ncbi:MAG: hypothetical protein Q8936_25300, partial [Bacillota bacterium]|nr:hypothetical protein [Bacillota bacterium]
LVAFNPFYFRADIGVTIGASLRVNLLFTTVTFSVELGATMGLWGPPTGGKVHVSWFIISFTINFGADEDPKLNSPAVWQDFKPLIPELSSICSLQANNGLSKTIDKDAAGEKKIWIVRAGDFSFYSQTAIPFSDFVCKSSNTVKATKDSENNQPYNVMIRIMNKTNVKSIHEISILRDGKEFDVSAWSIKPYYQDVPSALWGKPLTDGNGEFIRNPEVPSNDTVPQAPVGLNVVPPLPVLGYSAGEMIFDVFKYDDILPNGEIPISKASPAGGFVPAYASDTIEKISGIMDSSEGGAKSCRDSIYDVLIQTGLYDGTNGTLNNLAANSAQLYTDEPLKL